jgi:hypothetical protein
VRTAAPFGVLVTAAGLPKAFHHFIAIERLVAAELLVVTGWAALAGYAVVYCLPCLLLAAGALWGDRVRPRLQLLFDRFGRARDMPPGIPALLGLALLGIGVAGAAVTA